MKKKTETAAVSLLRNASSIHVNTDYPQCGMVGREVSRTARSSAGKKSRQSEGRKRVNEKKGWDAEGDSTCSLLTVVGNRR